MLAQHRDAPHEHGTKRGCVAGLGGNGSGFRIGVLGFLGFGLGFYGFWVLGYGFSVFGFWAGFSGFFGVLGLRLRVWLRN